MLDIFIGVKVSSISQLFRELFGKILTFDYLLEKIKLIS